MLTGVFAVFGFRGAALEVQVAPPQGTCPYFIKPLATDMGCNVWLPWRELLLASCNIRGVYDVLYVLRAIEC
jgi:hypothetical protein